MAQRLAEWQTRRESSNLIVNIDSLGDDWKNKKVVKKRAHHLVCPTRSRVGHQSTSTVTAIIKIMISGRAGAPPVQSWV
jgi:hypothetical protein